MGFVPPMLFGYGGGTAEAKNSVSLSLSLSRKSSFGGFGKGYGRGFSDPKETDVFFGTVKAINEKGFGHIASEAMTRIYGKDIFTHRTESRAEEQKSRERRLRC